MIDSEELARVETQAVSSREILLRIASDNYTFRRFILIVNDSKDHLAVAALRIEVSKSLEHLRHHNPMIETN